METDNQHKAKRTERFIFTLIRENLPVAEDTVEPNERNLQRWYFALMVIALGVSALRTMTLGFPQ